MKSILCCCPAYDWEDQENAQDTLSYLHPTYIDHTCLAIQWIIFSSMLDHGTQGDPKGHCLEDREIHRMTDAVCPWVDKKR